jgi:hypothetical protein
MATAPQIPFSNPAGKNQTNPSPILSAPTNPIPGSPQAAPGSNPYIPPSVPGSASGGPIPLQNTNPGTTSSSQGFITSGTDAGQNALQKQLTDIYGQGTGASLFSLLNSMSGTDSTVLQEYIASLQPQEAVAKANTNAALGAGGVGANSSVTGIADANLQAQEQASIASESANLTQNQEQLTAQILEGTEGAAAKEVATSNWSIFGDVLSQVGSDAAQALGGGSLGKVVSTAANVAGSAANAIPTTPGSTDSGSDDGLW